MKKLLIAASLVLVASASHAAITMQIQADLLQDQLGNAIPQQSLYLIIADTNRDGIASPTGAHSTAVGSRLGLFGGSDDIIVYRGDLSIYGLNGVLFDTASNIDTALFPGWDVGDPLSLLWLPTHTKNSTTFITGERYGAYTNALAVDNSEAWTTPANTGGSRSLGFYTKNGTELSPGPTATNDAVRGRSTDVIPAPEPTTVSLLAFGVAGLALRRRRK